MEASSLPAPAPLARISISAPLLRLRSDEQLVALFRAGSEEAFRAIHDRYRQRLFAYTRQMLSGSRQDAEDTLQDVFLRAYHALRNDDRPISLRAWLYRVAHNRCIDHIRRPVPGPIDLLDVSRRPAIDPIDATERREDLRRLIDDVRRLPDQQRSALLMRELQGMTYEELAGALDVTVAAVKSLLVRARMGLADAATARDTECLDIREDLSLSCDRGVRASGLARRHLRDCAGCRDYRDELRSHRRAVAALVPAGPLGSLGVLAKAVGLGGPTAAAGGATASAGGGVAALTAAKVAAVVCCAAAVTGGALNLTAPPARHHAHHTPAARVAGGAASHESTATTSAASAGSASLSGADPRALTSHGAAGAAQANTTATAVARYGHDLTPRTLPGHHSTAPALPDNTAGTTKHTTTTTAQTQSQALAGPTTPRNPLLALLQQLLAGLLPPADSSSASGSASMTSADVSGTGSSTTGSGASTGTTSGQSASGASTSASGSSSSEATTTGASASAPSGTGPSSTSASGSGASGTGANTSGAPKAGTGSSGSSSTASTGATPSASGPGTRASY